MSRLREFAKEKQRRHEDDSVDPRRKCLLVKKMVTKGDPSSCGDMKRVNEKGSVVSVTLATPTQ